MVNLSPALMYSLQEGSSKLEPKISLPLKGSWIRSLAFVNTSQGGSIMLASASDKVIKTWEICEAP